MTYEKLVGTSAAAMRLREAIARVSNSDAPLLIAGAAGCGKETTARLIHSKSRRARRPFIVLNCADLTPDDADEALFGSDAADLQDNWIGTILGAVDQANGGMLLLRSIQALPDDCQRKLLLLLTNGAFERAKGNLAIAADVRVAVATTDNLAAAVAAGKLRRDLYDRLQFNRIDVPSLPARRGDIPLLVQHFLKRSSEAAGLPVPDIEAPALAVLQAASWPGNVRDLRDFVERLALAARETGGPIMIRHMSAAIRLRDGDGTNGGEPPAADSYMFDEGRAYIDELFLFAQVMRFGGERKWLANALRKLQAAFHQKGASATAAETPKLIES